MICTSYTVGAGMVDLVEVRSEDAGAGHLLVDRGVQALLAGCFNRAEGLARQAAATLPADARPHLLAAAIRREQGRPAEAEVLLRGLRGEHTSRPDARALLAAVLADLGRDAEARRHLEAVAGDPSPSVAALAAEVCAALELAGPARALVDRLAGLACAATAGGAGLAGHGSPHRHVGLLCHVLDRWDEAEAHFEAALAANLAAGAPVVVAHTRRQYSALLRARGGDGDWERALDLLADAVATYRRLEITPLADDAEDVLRRSQGPGPPGAAAAGGGGNRFRLTDDGWELAFAGYEARLAHTAGLAHIAALMAAGGRPVHSVDLVAGVGGGDLAAHAVEEYRGRLDVLAAGTAWAGDAVAEAERDFLEAELVLLGDGLAAVGQVGERARRLVAVRIRTSLDLIDAAIPPLAWHLRRGIRTGTFCVYDPDRPASWGL